MTTDTFADRIAKGMRRCTFRLRNLGKQRFECPVCGFTGPFQDLGVATGFRRHAKCFNCGALERHRIQYLVLARILGSMDTAQLRMLHVAPEPFFREFFSARFGRYVTADLHRQDVDHQVDLQALPFGDASFDFVFASHVLEHVPDDIRALSEIRRILKPGGIAVLPIPLIAHTTVEYPGPNPHESNHVRAPGFDYFDRYQRFFSRVERVDSDSLPARYQLYIYEDRSGWPTPDCPLRPPMQGERHADVVPVCYV